MTDIVLSVPGKFRRGGLKQNEMVSIKSGQWLIDLMCREFKRKNMADVSLLDMGCGTKLTQAFLQFSIPIKRYVGIDIYKEMVDFLKSSVNDERFSYHHMNSHNAMYNPDGVLLSDTTELPVGDERFDIISLFSVFTHLAPHDYTAMLKVLRPYIKPEGRLIYSLFINEKTEGGYGLIDRLKKDLEMKGIDPSITDDVEDFHDAFEDDPLKQAVYARHLALKLVEGTGWEVETLNQPCEYIQHYIICRPV